MNDLMPFEFDNQEVRVVEDNSGSPLFVAKDVLASLGYDVSNVPNRIKNVPDEWRGSYPIATPSGTQEMAVLTEQGLYFFVARSDKPKALPFQKWIAGEVLPQIRKNGSYSQQQLIPQDYVAALRAAADAYEAKQRAEAEARALQQDNQLLNTIIDNEFGYCSILRAAQHLGIDEKTFKWQALKSKTLEMGLDIKRAPSPRYAYQNLYPIAAFEHCYPQYDFSGLQPEAVADRHIKLLGGQLLAMH